MHGLLNKLNNFVQAAGAAIKNPKTVSDFYETGEITPQEFVEAGDKLINTNAIWRWRGSETPAMDNKSLPPNR